MRRCEFIAGLGGAAAWPLEAGAQQPLLRVIGFLSPGSAATRRMTLPAVRQGLAEFGYVEGQNLTIEYRWAGERNELLPELAAELVRQQVSAIIALGGERGALAAKAATSEIPVIFGVASDPVEDGLVRSLNRPKGNVTGVSVLTIEVTAKGVEFLHELLLAATTIALLVDPSNAGEAAAEIREITRAANFFGLQLIVLKASTPNEIEAVFAKLAQQAVDALVVTGGAFFIIQNDQIVAVAAQHHLPTVFQYRESAQAGGLMSYGTDQVDTWRLVGNYAGRILKGEKPADLPVQRSTKVNLVINLKTAGALGLTIPPNLLALADEVIEMTARCRHAAVGAAAWPFVRRSALSGTEELASFSSPAARARRITRRSYVLRKRGIGRITWSRK
jgi:putative tryptophan/tyrosine transport system substrate-binding protein